LAEKQNGWQRGKNSRPLGMSVFFYVIHFAARLKLGGTADFPPHDWGGFIFKVRGNTLNKQKMKDNMRMKNKPRERCCCSIRRS
jgi:hypothetical protein